MEPHPLLIRSYEAADEASVITLWQRCGLVRPANDPCKDIARKVADSPELFLVGTIDQRVVVTAMAGYDGHRGWVNYLAVAPEWQRHGFGARIMAAVETLLRSLGCAKLNVQVRATNATVVEFYRDLGFTEDFVISLGKRLVRDE